MSHWNHVKCIHTFLSLQLCRNIAQHFKLAQGNKPSRHCKTLLPDVKPDSTAKNGWNSIQFSTNPIHNSFYHPFHPPSHYRCSNALVSAGETNEFQFMIQFSKHPKRQWLSVDFIQAEMSIEVEIDTSVENCRKKDLFLFDKRPKNNFILKTD